MTGVVGGCGSLLFAGQNFAGEGCLFCGDVDMGIGPYCISSIKVLKFVNGGL